MQTNITITPLEVPTDVLAAAIRRELDQVRANRKEEEEIVADGFDDLVAVLDASQKGRVVDFIRASFGTEPEEIVKENERQAKLRALRKQQQADIEDAPYLAALALYENITNKTVQVAPNDWAVQFLQSTSEQSA